MLLHGKILASWECGTESQLNCLNQIYSLFVSFLLAFPFWQTSIIRAYIFRSTAGNEWKCWKSCCDCQHLPCWKKPLISLIDFIFLIYACRGAFLLLRWFSYVSLVFFFRSSSQNFILWMNHFSRFVASINLNSSRDGKYMGKNYVRSKCEGQGRHRKKVSFLLPILSSCVSNKSLWCVKILLLLLFFFVSLLYFTFFHDGEWVNNSIVWEHESGYVQSRITNGYFEGI